MIKKLGRSARDLSELLALAPGLAKLRLAWAWLTGEGTVTIRFEGRDLRFEVADRSELRVLGEMFLRGEYEDVGRPDAAVVVDLGAHIGASVAFERIRYPKARIIAVEADPITTKRLRANTTGMNVEIVNAAVLNYEGDIELHRGNHSWETSFLPYKGTGEEILVPAVSLPGLLAAHGVDRVDVLKMDIEGAEAYVLRPDHLQGVQTIVFEYHPALVEESLDELVGRLPDFTLRRQVGEPPGAVVAVLDRR